MGRAALLIARSPRQSAPVTWIAPPIPALCFRKRGWTMNRKLGALYGVATAVLLATQPPLSSPAAKAMSPIKFVFLTQVALLISVPLLLSRTRPFPRDRLKSSLDRRRFLTVGRANAAFSRHNSGTTTA
jgi:hypothetical protein